MKRKEAWHVADNYGAILVDEMRAEVSAIAAAAEPGQWLVRDGVVVRFSGEPVRSAESMEFIARAREWVPAFLRAIDKMEAAWRSATAIAESTKRELRLERDQHEEAMRRANARESGPDYALWYIAEAMRLGYLDARAGAARLRRWAMGEDTQIGEFQIDVERAARNAADARAADEEQAKRLRRAWREYEEMQALLKELRLTKAEREELVARAKSRVAGAADKLEGGV